MAKSEVLSEIDEEELAEQLLCDGRQSSSSSCAMAAGAAVIVRWPPEQQICRAFIEAAEEVIARTSSAPAAGAVGWAAPRNHRNMYGRTYSKNMDQPGKVANPARGQLNRENESFPVRVRA